MTLLRWDRNLLGLERSLGLKSERGISRQSNKDAPIIEALLESIKLIAKQWVSRSNREIRQSEVLKQDALGLFDEYGPQIWPDDHPRPVWLEAPSDESYDGRYPRHLYFSDPDDRDILSSYFCDLVVEKCIKYHDNQLQKHRRLSKVANVTPTKNDVESEDDNDDTELLDRLGAAVDDVDEPDIDDSEARPASTWAPVNKIPEARKSITPDEPAPHTEPTSSVIMHATKSEPAYSTDFYRHYVSGGESPDSETLSRSQQQTKLRSSVQADKLQSTEERRDSAMSKDATSRAGSAPAYTSSISRKRPRAADADEPVFKVKRRKGGAKWSWMFTFKVDPEKLRKMSAGERVAPPIVSEDSDYWSEGESNFGETRPHLVESEIGEPPDSPGSEHLPEPEAVPGAVSQAEPEDSFETGPEAVRVGAMRRRRSILSLDTSSLSEEDDGKGDLHSSPSEVGESAPSMTETAIATSIDAASSAEASKDTEMSEYVVDESKDQGMPDVSNAVAAELPSAAASTTKLTKERQNEQNNLRGIIAENIWHNMETRNLDVANLASSYAAALEVILYDRTDGGARYEQGLVALKAKLRANRALVPKLIDKSLTAEALVVRTIEVAGSQHWQTQVASNSRYVQQPVSVNGSTPKLISEKKSGAAEVQSLLADARRRASDAAAGTIKRTPTDLTKQAMLSSHGTPLRRASAPKSTTKAVAPVKPLMTQPRTDHVVGFRATVTSPTERAFGERRIDDITQPVTSANFRPLSAAPTQGKFQIAPPNTCRCICNREPSPYDQGQLIQCSSCKVMQHKICMGVPPALPRGHLYCCEQCRPDAHVETVKALKAGHRIWEVRANNWIINQQQQAAKQQGVSSSPHLSAHMIPSTSASGHAHPSSRPVPVLPSQSPSAQPQTVNFGNSLPPQHIKQVNKHPQKLTHGPLYQTEMVAQELGRRILGDLIQLPMAQLILSAGAEWDKEQLLDLKHVLTNVPAAGQDLSVLAKHLFPKRRQPGATRSGQSDAVKNEAALGGQQDSRRQSIAQERIELDVVIKWNRDLEYDTDYMPFPQVTTADEFFAELESNIPDDLSNDDKMIREVRVRSQTELKCGPLPRLVRKQNIGDANLRALHKKLRSLPKDSELELEFFVVWQDKSKAVGNVA